MQSDGLQARRTEVCADAVELVDAGEHYDSLRASLTA